MTEARDWQALPANLLCRVIASISLYCHGLFQFCPPAGAAKMVLLENCIVLFVQAFTSSQ